MRWPEEIPSFQGRECELDGLVKGLNQALPYLVYRPPPDFFGPVQLEFLIFKTDVAGPSSWSFAIRRVFEFFFMVYKYWCPHVFFDSYSGFWAQLAPMPFHILDLKSQLRMRSWVPTVPTTIREILTNAFWSTLRFWARTIHLCWSSCWIPTLCRKTAAIFWSWAQCLWVISMPTTMSWVFALSWWRDTRGICWWCAGCSGPWSTSLTTTPWMRTNVWWTRRRSSLTPQSRNLVETHGGKHGDGKSH